MSATKRIAKLPRFARPEFSRFVPALRPPFMHRLRRNFTGLCVVLSAAIGFLACSGGGYAQITGTCSTPPTGTLYSNSATIATPNELSNSDESGPPYTPYDASPYPSAITVPSNIVGTVTGVQVVLHNVSAPGNSESNPNANALTGMEVLLVSPSGAEFEILGNVGYAAASGSDSDPDISGLTILIGSGTGFSDAPNNVNTANTGTVCWDPSAYEATGEFSSPVNTGDIKYPQTTGTSTLSYFNGQTAAGTWSLYVVDDFGNPDTILGWDLYLTVDETSVGTTTVISPSTNPVYNTSPTNSVTFTATVSSESGTPTGGTVAFYANGSATPISCSGGNQVLSGGQATCTTTLSAGSESQCTAGTLPAWPTACQGINSIEAVYSGSGSYQTSNGTLTELVEAHATGTAASSGPSQFCNSGPITAPDETVGMLYPSVIGVSGYANGTTVGNVTVELEDVTSVDVSDQFVLVAPGGGAYNLDILDDVWGTYTATNVSFSVADTGTQPDRDAAPSGGATYVPYDANVYFPNDIPPTSSAPTYDSGIPQVPSTLNRPQTVGGANAYTLEQAFNGAQANGDWALYVYGDEAVTLNGGWCVTLTPNTGNPTTTVVSSTHPKATTGQSVTITATVGSSDGTPTGTVTFVDSTLGTTLASNTPLSGGVATYGPTTAFTEGDHKITATYTPTGDFNSSFGFVWQRVDDATVVTAAGSTAWNFCNPGAVEIQPGIAGAYTPNPSNIFVSNFPGSLNSMALTLSTFSLSQTAIYETASLIEGPSGAALDFFSNTGGTGNEQATQGNYVFEDSASGLVPDTETDISPGAYKPTAYPPTYDSADKFISSISGYYPAPGTFTSATNQGSGTFGSVFPSGLNPDGTWSLFFNEYSGEGVVEGATNGWCLQLAENPPVVTVLVPSTSTFTQGQQGASFTVTVNNTGPGSTNDPTLGSAPMTVTDTLNSAFTYASYSGTGWSCSASAQTVTCANDSSVADGNEYPQLTIDVNVSNTASGSISNSVTAQGAGVASTNSDTDTITILAATTTSAANQTTTYSTNDQSVPLSATVTANSGTVNSGTVTFAVFNGATQIGSSVTSGTVTGGNASASYTLPGGTGAGTYTITATYNPGSGYAGSSDSSHTLQVNAITPTITWTPVTTIIFGDAGANVLNATVNCTSCGTITYSTVIGGTPTAITSTTTLVAGSYTITATFNPNPGYNTTSATSPLTVSGESVWIVDGGGGTSELAGNGYGITSSAYTGANLAVAIDNVGNVWSAGTGASLLVETSQVGTHPNTIASGTGGLDAPAGIAIDGASQVWVTNGNSSVSLFTDAGAPLSPSGGFTDPSLSTPSGVAVDLGGSVWIANTGNNSVTRILGAAVPVAPLATAAKNNTTGAKP
jgi:hypothetical protein